MNNQRLHILFDKHLEDTLTPAERAELQQLVQATPLDELENILVRQLQQQTDVLPPLSLSAAQAAIAELVSLDKRTAPSAPEILPVQRRVHFLRRSWLRYAAAIIILLGIGAYFYYAKEKPTTASTQTLSAKIDIAPGRQRAMLTLADGSIINLDSAANGQLSTQGNSSIIKTKDGQLIYELSSGHEPAFADERSESVQRAKALRSSNTMSTPRGGTYQLTLPDGTQVWLNAASSITYPIAFTNNERKVSITGEVYFEVTRNPTKPFHVQTSQQNITVLGTSFNINAYDNETAHKTSLLEGSIKVNQQLIKPGQACANNKIISTNAQQDIAWRNGLFNIQNKTLSEVMRLLSRWYDIERVDYKPGIKDTRFGGEIPMNLRLSEVIQLLDRPGLHFHIEQGNLLTITP